MSVEPSVVSVVNAVIEEAERSVSVMVDPSGFVKVSTFEARSDDLMGSTVSVDPSVVIVVKLAIEDRDGSVKVTNAPSGSVSVSTIDPKG